MSEEPHEFLGPVRIRISMVREDGAGVPRLIRTPEEASQYADALRDSDREVFAAILLNARNATLGIHECTVGTLSSTQIDPASVFKAALLANAAAVILCHNHPSGDPSPSAHDVKCTRRIMRAGRIIGIPVLDHVILGGPGQFESLRQSGVVTFAV